jgi:hypothetical protein
MNADERINWLLEGDVSVQYQTHRDLLDTDRPDLRQRISEEGWGKEFLNRRLENGHWGNKYYQPKWTSTHYTLMDLKHLGISPKNETIRQTIDMVFRTEKGPDGGILPGVTIPVTDLCINGMALNYASYFGIQEEEMKSVVDNILSQQLPDGGFNCELNRYGAVHSSLHTTISVIEGILEYANNGYTYRIDALKKAEVACREFILMHRLYKSDKTGEIIDKKMLMLSYPSRWKYDILRGLDHFQFAGAAYDSRMDDAIEVLLKKQRKDRLWPVQAKHPGQTHFDMEATGKPSRWNTLRALRVLRHFQISK